MVSCLNSNFPLTLGYLNHLVPVDQIAHHCGPVMDTMISSKMFMSIIRVFIMDKANDSLMSGRIMADNKLIHNIHSPIRIRLLKGNLNFQCRFHIIFTLQATGVIEMQAQ